jgi:hypothetical protein
MPWFPVPGGFFPPPLGGKLKSGSSPSATTWGRDKVRVYFFDDNNHLCFQEGYNRWSDVVDTGIVIDPPDPNTTGIVVSPAAVNTGNGVRIFFRGQNNSLWWITSADGNNFQAAIDIGGGSYLTSDPSAALRAGSVEVFYRGRGGILIWRSLDLNLGWSPEKPFGGIILRSSPAAVSWGGNRLDVFYRGGNDALGILTDDGGGFGGGQDRGEQLTSSPAVTSWEPGRLDVFFRGLNGHLWHKYHQEGVVDWPAADDRGLFMSEGASPTAVSIAPGKLAAFYSIASEICMLEFY